MPARSSAETVRGILVLIIQEVSLAPHGLALAALLTASFPALTDSWPDISKPPAGSKADGAKDAAAIIAVEDYTYAPDVPGARRNAQDWYSWLSKARGVPSTRIHMRLDHEGTDTQIREAAARAASQARQGGTLWFIWIGHGAPAKDGSDGLLVGADAQASAASIYDRSVARAEVAEILGVGAQQRTVMVLDACFSGKTNSGQALAEGLQPLVPVSATVDSRVTLLSATQRDQFAGPLPGAARPAYSYLLLGALRGWGDEDGDRRVTAGEATRYAREVMLAVVTDRRQEPALQGPGADWALGGGREAGPDLARFVVSAPAAGSSPSESSGSGGLAIGSTGGSGGMLDKLAQLELAQRQRKAQEAQLAEAAAKERELLAALQAERDEKLDAAVSTKRREVAEVWRRMAGLVEQGGPEAKQAVELFVKEYGTAEVWVEDRTGRYERAVRSPAVVAARELLKEWAAEEPPAIKPASALHGGSANLSPDGPSDPVGHGSRGLLAGGLGTALAGGALLAASAALDEKFLVTKDQGDAERYYTLNHAAFWAGAAVGVAGTGLVVGAVVKGNW